MIRLLLLLVVCAQSGHFAIAAESPESSSATATESDVAAERIRIPVRPPAGSNWEEQLRHWEAQKAAWLKRVADSTEQIAQVRAKAQSANAESRERKQLEDRLRGLEGQRANELSFAAGADLQIKTVRKEMSAPAPDASPDHGLIIGGLTSYRETAARGIAEQRGLRLFRIEVAGYIRADPAETDKSFDALIAMAQPAKVALFIDKADVLFGGARSSASPRGLDKVYGGKLLEKLRQAPVVVILGLVSESFTTTKPPGWTLFAPPRPFIDEDIRQK